MRLRISNDVNPVVSVAVLLVSVPLLAITFLGYLLLATVCVLAMAMVVVIAGLWMAGEGLWDAWKRWRRR